MVELLIWRHAKTEKASGDQSDRERRLLPVGRQDAEDVARTLAHEELTPQVILCSDSVRTRETADIAVSHFPSAPDRYELPELYDADADDLVDIVKIYAPKARRVLLIGHNPSVEEFVSGVTGRESTMKTGYLAVVTAPVAGAGELDPSVELHLKKTIIPARRR